MNCSAAYKSLGMFYKILPKLTDLQSFGIRLNFFIKKSAARCAADKKSFSVKLCGVSGMGRGSEGVDHSESKARRFDPQRQGIVIAARVGSFLGDQHFMGRAVVGTVAR